MRRHPETVWRVAPQFLVLGRTGRTPLTVTGPAVDVWALLADDLARRDIGAVLADRYGAPLDVVAADVEALIDRLVEEGFVIDGG